MSFAEAGFAPLRAGGALEDVAVPPTDAPGDGALLFAVDGLVASAAEPERAAAVADASLRALALPVGQVSGPALLTARAALRWARERAGAPSPRVDLAVAHLDARLSPPLARPAPDDRLGWPVRPAVVTSAYGVRPDPLDGDMRYHRGVDLRAREGQMVVAARGGAVVFAGAHGGYGLVVELAHDGGLTTRYAHLRSLAVGRGDRVVAGEPVGEAGSSGRVTGAHLHFEVSGAAGELDPLTLLGEPDDIADAEARAAPKG